MGTVFLSYASKDRFFAELARLKLEGAGISVWVDNGRLRAGDDWRQGIDRGISEAFAVLLALSEHSNGSSYVTYEWASAMGKGKSIVPVLLEPCDLHPKLEPIQYIDFSHGGYLPWPELVDRLNEIQAQDETPQIQLAAESSARSAGSKSKEDKAAERILDYLNRRGFQMVSNERIRERIDPGFTDEFIDKVLKQHSDTFRPARLKGKRTGLAKL